MKALALLLVAFLIFVGSALAVSSADDFDRASLGPNWRIHVGDPGIIGSSDLGLRSGKFGLLSWAHTWGVGPNQFSEAEISEGSDEGMAKGVYVRRRASDGARYQLHYDTNGTPAEPRPHWQIKYDGVSSPKTRVLAIALSPSAPVAGDVLRIEVQGETLRGYKNGQLVLTATDSAISSGTFGVAFTTSGLVIPLPSRVFERWAGGAL